MLGFALGLLHITETAIILAIAVVLGVAVAYFGGIFLGRLPAILLGVAIGLLPVAYLAGKRQEAARGEVVELKRQLADARLSRRLSDMAATSAQEIAMKHAADKAAGDIELAKREIENDSALDVKQREIDAFNASPKVRDKICPPIIACRPGDAYLGGLRNRARPRGAVVPAARSGSASPVRPAQRQRPVMGNPR